MTQDPGEVGELLGDAAVDLDADLDAEPRGILADLVQRLADPLEGGFAVGPLGDTVGTDLHSRRADVVSQPDVFLGPLDILADHGRVGRLELERGPQPGQLDRRILEPLPDLQALVARQVGLDLVRVGRPQLDPGIPQLLQPGEDRGEVPVLGDVVGDDPQLKHRPGPLLYKMNE
jgi:hypothetical protein